MSREVRADDKGRFVFLTLLPGVYRLYAGRPDARQAAKGTLLFGSHMITSTPAGLEEYSASNETALGPCYEAANRPIELSPGLEYLTTIELHTHC